MQPQYTGTPTTVHAYQPLYLNSPTPRAQYSPFQHYSSTTLVAPPPPGTAPFVPPYIPPPTYQPPKPAKKQPERRAIEIVDPTTGQRVDISSFKKKEEPAAIPAPQIPNPVSEQQQTIPVPETSIPSTTTDTGPCEPELCEIIDDGPLVLPSRPHSAPPTLTEREDSVCRTVVPERVVSPVSCTPERLVYTYETLMELRTEYPIPSHLRSEGLKEIFVEHMPPCLPTPAPTPAPKVVLRAAVPLLGSPTKLQPAAPPLVSEFNRDSFATAAAPEKLLQSTQFTSRLPGRAEMGQRLPIFVPIVVQPPPPPPAQQLPNRAEEPFKPNKAGQDSATKLLKKVVGILNRITPEKYNTLVQMLYEVLDDGAQLINEEVLSSIIQQVHERAMEQPNYSDMWAKLCSDICTRIQAKAEGKNTLENFRRILLNTCQERFNKGVDRTDDDPGDDRFRQHSKGNIKFIGELFKQTMLSERIMHFVIKKLLLETDHRDPKNTNTSAESLEVLATFLSTAGQNLDRQEAMRYFNHYFEQMALLSKHHPVPRVRFMLLDLIEMRKNGWKERRKEIKATTLGELEKHLAGGKKA